MTNEEAIKLIDDRMCWGRGKWSKHHMPEIDEYWQAGLMAIEALKAQIATDTNVGSKGGDTIYRQAAIEWCLEGLNNLPSAQLDRDIPKKPGETTDRSWGIPHRQAVCPNCDSYLGTIHFICEGDKRKVTFCESCGQAVDWEGWEEDE